MENFVVAALYKFAKLSDYQDMQPLLQRVCLDNNIRGTLLLAAEGINGTIAGSRTGIDQVLAYLRADARLHDLEHKESFAAKNPFYRMKVRLKNEIVTMGVDSVDPEENAGTYVEAQDWNDLIAQGIPMIDTRNTYEVAIGTFKGAINPEITTFREFPQYFQENFSPESTEAVAMFCTGGIRCEKSTAYAKSLGFKKVYHLKGGILKYLETVPEEDSLWEGDCFVFDNRVAVTHNLAEGAYDQCFGCRHPISKADVLSDQYIKGVSCPHCWETQSADTRRRAHERQKQMELAKARAVVHLGMDAQNCRSL